MSPQRRPRGEGSIFQTANGQWRARLRLGVVDGVRKVREGRFPSQRAAVAALRRWLAERDAGLPPGDGRLRVDAFLERWLESARPRLRPRTVASYDLAIRRVRPDLGHRLLTQLSPADLQRCYARLLARGLRGRPLARRSVQQVHTVLHTAFRQAVRWGLLARNPADAAVPPRPERRAVRTLTAAEAARLVTESGDDRLHALWVLLCTTGLRLGEALGLLWADLDLDGGTLVVRRTLARQRGHGLVLAEPKTAASRRTVHLTAGAAAALIAHRDRQQAERQQAGPLWVATDLVFTTPTGQPLAPEAVTRAFHRLTARLGLPRLRVHDLRHTAASLLLQWGTHPKVVQELLGHTSIGITLDLYSHVVPALHHEAAQKFHQLFAGPPPPAGE